MGFRFLATIGTALAVEVAFGQTSMRPAASILPLLATAAFRLDGRRSGSVEGLFVPIHDH